MKSYGSSVQMERIDVEAAQNARKNPIKTNRLMLTLWIGLLSSCLLWNSYSLFSYKGYILGIDDNFYFAWARSIVLDGDVDFSNDFEFVATNNKLGATQEHFAAYLNNAQETVTGYLPNKYGMGMGLAALPLLYLAKALFEIYAALFGVQPNDFSSIYPWVYLLNSITFGFLGLALSYKVLESGFGKKIALCSIVIGVLGLPIGYYIWFEPTMAHAISFGFATIFLISAIHWMKTLKKYSQNKGLKPLFWASLAMGFSLGVSCTIRFTNVLFALVPFIFAVKVWKNLDGTYAVSLPRIGFFCLALATMAALIGFSPQLIAWKKIYGSWILYTYQGGTLSIWPKYAFKILFGLRNSLFVWSPLAIIAVVGLFIGASSGKVFPLSGLIVLGSFVWVYGSWEGYSLGHGYGMRGLVDCSFFFFLGFAEIMKTLKGRALEKPFLLKIGALLILFLVLWNLYFLFCYRSFLQPHGKPFAGLRLFSDPRIPLKQALCDVGLRSLTSLDR